MAVNPQGKPDLLKLLNDSDDLINPATEDKQDDIITAIGSIGGDVTTLGQGRKTVAVTNTAIVLGSGAVKTVHLTALTGNSDVIVWGGTGIVYSPEGSRLGSVLYPGDKVDIPIDNLSKIYINGVAGDGVTFTYAN